MIGKTPDIVCSAHRPILFEFSEVQTNANNPIVQFRVRVLNYFNYKEYGTIYIKAQNNPITISFYFGKADISGLIKKQLPPYSYAPNSGAYNRISLSFVFIVEPMMLNNNGLLEDFGTSYSSDLFTAVSCATLPEEYYGLQDYQTGIALKKCFTNNDFGFEVTKWQGIVLTALADEGALQLPTINACFIYAYDNAGNMIKVIYFDVYLSLYQPQQIIDVSQNLGIDFWWQYATTVLPGSIDNIAYFDASFGRVNTVAGVFQNYEPKTREYRYKVINCGTNDETMVLQWLNIRGGQDTYVFNKSKIKTLNTKGQIGEAPLQWYQGEEDPTNNYPIYRGKFKYDTQSITSYELISRKLSKKEVEWIRELIESNDVFFQIKTNNSVEFLPCIVQDASFTMYDNSELYEVLRLKIILSNERIIQ
jgi:hypothetical protein